MNYVVSYWVSPDTREERKDALRIYFDLQRYTKAQFGAEQLIVTNLDYPGAIPLQLPAGFRREFGMFAKFLGLGQLIRDGLEFPITVHDHDMFVRDALQHDDSAIICASGGDAYFSDQIVIFPEISRAALMDFIERLEDVESHPPLLHSGYGSEIRHEGMYSTESIHCNMQPRPFADIPIKVDIPYRDLVSFDIQGHHSLDPAECECGPIPDDVLAVHGHLNKGPATDQLVNWLTRTKGSIKHA